MSIRDRIINLLTPAKPAMNHKARKWNDLEAALLDSIMNRPGDWQISEIDFGYRCFNQKIQCVTVANAMSETAFRELDGAVGAEFRAAWGSAAIALAKRRMADAAAERQKREVALLRRNLKLDQ